MLRQGGWWPFWKVSLNHDRQLDKGRDLVAWDYRTTDFHGVNQATALPKGRLIRYRPAASWQSGALSAFSPIRVYL
jgi:hypothetical protein